MKFEIHVDPFDDAELNVMAAMHKFCATYLERCVSKDQRRRVWRYVVDRIEQEQAFDAGTP